MLTKMQVVADAESLVEDLVTDLKARDLHFQDEREILLHAAAILGLASKVLVKMIKDKPDPTKH